MPQPTAATPANLDSDRSRGDRERDDRKTIGQILGSRYRLERELRRCGLGTVYLANDLEANDTHFAVNVLRSEFRSFSEALTQLRAEVRVTRMLRHPHIARVYSLNSERPVSYLVTEYLDGRTLDAHLHDTGNALPLNEALPVIADMCAALAYAHDLEVVHGDLQPENVFLAASGRAKLLDFGLARAAATRNGRLDLRRVGALTMAYASFEMLQGQAPDPRDDVYSLACLIYTMLSGAHPFDLRSAVEARRVALAMTPLVVLSSDQNAALARGLAFERAQRTPSVTALLADLGVTADPSLQSPSLQSPSLQSPSLQSPPLQSPPLQSPSLQSPPPESQLPSAPSPQPPAVAAPATAHRAARRVTVRLPLPPMILPSTDLPPLEATSKAPPQKRFARRNVLPALIVLSVVAVGIGVALVYRGHPSASSATRPEPASNPSPASSSVSSTASDAAVASSSPAAVPRAGPVANPHKSNPPAVADTKVAATAHSGAPIAILRPLPKAAAEMEDNDNCPYPRTAMDQGLTGTVFLLVYVTSDGTPTKTKLDKTSGSDVLDQAAIRCVEQFGRFPAPTGGSASDGYWGRIRFKWSFGI